MGNFDTETRLDGGNGRYRASLSPDWEVWGPLGGYVTAIALRAIGLETDLRRPASISCQFLSVAKFEEVDVEVTSLRRGKRSHALHARISQKGTPVLAATAWVTDENMSGLDHDVAKMPDVPGPESLKRYAELATNYGEWFPAWHRSIDGKPTTWSVNPAPSAPVWHTWMRLLEPTSLADPFLDAARSLMWMDLMMWNAATPPHMPWEELTHIAPNLDVTAIFHESGAGDEWLLCDGYAPVGRGGLIGCEGRVWSPSGKLVASGNACLFCRPNPYLEKGALPDR